MNGILVFGIIFLVITLCVKPFLVKSVPEDACHQGYEDVADNKKYFKLALLVSISMVIIGIVLSFVK